MEVKKFADIKRDLINNFMALQRKITDFNRGSVADSIFDSVAREEEKKYIAIKLGFAQNLKAIPYSLFDFTKKDGTYATGTAVFKRGNTKDYISSIPEGTEISGNGNLYVTTENGSIAANQVSSNPVKIRAVEIGSKYNTAINTVTTIKSALSSDIVEVYNNIKIDGGCDEETETEMLARFKDYLAGLQGTSLYGLKAAAENVDGVRSVNVVEDFTSGAMYRVILYAEDGSGGLASTVKQDIENVIEGDGSKTNPGKRAPGINVLVSEPESVNVSLSIKVTTHRADPSSAESEIISVVQNYINGLGIGENVILTTIILLLRALNYVTDVEILDPSSNVNVSNNQIARFSSCEVELDEE